MFSFLLPTLTLTCFWSQWQNIPPPPPARNTSHSQSTCYFSWTQGAGFFYFLFFHLFHETGMRLQTCMHNKSQSQKTSCLLAPSVGVWSRLRSLLSKRTPRHAGCYISRNKQVTEHVSSVLETDYLIIHFLFHNCFGLLTNLCISPVALSRYVIDQNI